LAQTLFDAEEWDAFFGDFLPLVSRTRSQAVRSLLSSLGESDCAGCYATGADCSGWQNDSWFGRWGTPTGPAHIVSAFSTDLGIAFGQERVEQKSNEITAIPELLEALYINGFLVSIDAMGCQKEIARKIVAKGGDYLLMVKGNQPGLLENVSAAFTEGRHADLPRFEHLDASHGRLVTQITWTAPAGAAAVNTEDWPNCKTVAMVASLRQVGDKTSDLEQRYYISSRDMTPETLAKAVRAHWAVENKLHWMLDVNFGEDACMVKKDNAPEILSLIRRVVINMLSLDTTQPSFTKKKLSKRQKRKFANWDEDIMRSILGIQPL
jgi:predicted transposase YbfD/YdcC